MTKKKEYDVTIVVASEELKDFFWDSFLERTGWSANWLVSAKVFVKVKEDDEEEEGVFVNNIMPIGNSLFIYEEFGHPHHDDLCP